MSNITKEINGKEYTFDVTTLDIKLVDYGGFQAHPTNPVECCADANPKTMLPNDT